MIVDTERNECPRCWYLEMVIVGLKLYIWQLKNEIKRLNKIIAKTNGYCQEVLDVNTKEMDAGEVPRARFGYLKGQVELAKYVISLLTGKRFEEKINQKDFQNFTKFKRLW